MISDLKVSANSVCSRCCRFERLTLVDGQLDVKTGLGGSSITHCPDSCSPRCRRQCWLLKLHFNGRCGITASQVELIASKRPAGAAAGRSCSICPSRFLALG